jgi:hypothetical protein
MRFSHGTNQSLKCKLYPHYAPVMIVVTTLVNEMWSGRACACVCVCVCVCVEVLCARPPNFHWGPGGLFPALPKLKLSPQGNF